MFIILHELPILWCQEVVCCKCNNPAILSTCQIHPCNLKCLPRSCVHMQQAHGLYTFLYWRLVQGICNMLIQLSGAWKMRPNFGNGFKLFSYNYFSSVHKSTMYSKISYCVGLITQKFFDWASLCTLLYIIRNLMVKFQQIASELSKYLGTLWYYKDYTARDGVYFIHWE